MTKEKNHIFFVYFTMLPPHVIDCGFTYYQGKLWCPLFMEKGFNNNDGI